MARVYADSDKMIYQNKSNALLGNSMVEQISYYTISGYKYEGSILRYVELDIIIDIAEFVKGKRKDVYRLNIAHPDISDTIKEDVSDYNRFAPMR